MITEQEYDEFEQRMLATYPQLFSQPFGGFAIGQGWWPVIEALCANIQSHVNHRNEQATKYNRGVPMEQPVVAQIKEKFGGLRFYLDGGDEQIWGMIRMAEAWADSSCEECGSPGKRRSGGWIRTLCDHHEQEHQQRMAQYATST